MAEVNDDESESRSEGSSGKGEMSLWPAISGIFTLLVARRFSYNYKRYKNPASIPAPSIRTAVTELDQAISLTERWLQSRGIQISNDRYPELDNLIPSVIQKQIEHHLYILQQEIPELLMEEEQGPDFLRTIDTLHSEADDDNMLSYSNDDLLDLLHALQELKIFLGSVNAE